MPNIQIPYTKKVFIAGLGSLNYDKSFLLKRDQKFFLRKTIKEKSHQISFIIFAERLPDKYDKSYSILGQWDKGKWYFLSSDSTSDLLFNKSNAEILLDAYINDEDDIFTDFKEFIDNYYENTDC